ncbi:MAG TPA: hypothetical protein VIE65_08795 [Methylobacter sp.]|jgi:hypothetical protein
MDDNILYKLAEEAYFLAKKNDIRDEWVTCIAYCNAYLQVGGAANIHQYYNFALNRIGRVQEALMSCNMGLSIDPHHPHLLHNKQLYENWLENNKVVIH